MKCSKYQHCIDSNLRTSLSCTSGSLHKATSSYNCYKVASAAAVHYLTSAAAAAAVAAAAAAIVTTIQLWHSAQQATNSNQQPQSPIIATISYKLQPQSKAMLDQQADMQVTKWHQPQHQPLSQQKMHSTNYWQQRQH